MFLIFRFFSISIDVVLMSLLLNLGNLIASVHLLFTLIMRSCLLAFQKYILHKFTVSRNLIFGSWISSKVNLFGMQKILLYKNSCEKDLTIFFQSASLNTNLKYFFFSLSLK